MFSAFLHCREAERTNERTTEHEKEHWNEIYVHSWLPGCQQFAIERINDVKHVLFVISNFVGF